MNESVDFGAIAHEDSLFLICIYSRSPPARRATDPALSGYKLQLFPTVKFWLLSGSFRRLPPSLRLPARVSPIHGLSPFTSQSCLTFATTGIMIRIQKLRNTFKNLPNSSNRRFVTGRWRIGLC